MISCKSAGIVRTEGCEGRARMLMPSRILSVLQLGFVPSVYSVGWVLSSAKGQQLQGQTDVLVKS